MTLRSAVGVGIGMAAMVYNTWTAFTDARNLRRFGGEQDPYAVGWVARRFAAVVEHLPPGTSVGYLTDVPPTVPERATYFVTTRYVLAPLLLQDATELPWVVGDFRRPENASNIISREGFRVERDLGNGAYLLRRRQR